MQQQEGEFLLDDAGRRLSPEALPLAEGPALDSKSEAIDRAVVEAGFVLIRSFQPVLLVRIFPPKVEPLAALEAIHEIRAAAPECVLLVWPLGRTWRRQRHEFLPSMAAAVERLGGIARFASRRAATEVRLRGAPPAMRYY